MASSTTDEFPRVEPTMDMTLNDTEGDDDSAMTILNFLRRIHQAADILSQTSPLDDDNEHDDDGLMKVDDDDDDDDETNTKSQDVLIEEIAQKLLEVCHPDVLAASTDHLPPFHNFDEGESPSEKQKDDLAAMMEHQRAVTMNTTVAMTPQYYYQYRRTDYLRRLLRVLAPASMQVAVQVASRVVLDPAATADPAGAEQQQQPSSSSKQRQLACILLFAHWLPVAPHLTTMVTEVLQSIEAPTWPTTTMTTTKTEGHHETTTRATVIVVVVVEALYQLCLHYHSRGEIATLNNLDWDWTFLLDLLHEHRRRVVDEDHDAVMQDASEDNDDDDMDDDTFSFSSSKALAWFSARTLVMLRNWKPSVTRDVLTKCQVDDDRVPWRIHPWEMDREELQVEAAGLTPLGRRRQIHLWNVRSDRDALDWPTAEAIQSLMRSSPYLSRLGPGITFYRQGSILATRHNDVCTLTTTESPGRRLVPTTTTRRNLALLGAALFDEPHPPPIIVCGPHGSGKSSLIRELLRQCRAWSNPHDATSSLIEFHIDDETDSKTLIGSYTTTDIPGEFVWRAGALTHASRQGRWVLIEDLDAVPVEIQAALVKLLEERRLPLGNGKYERSHPNFRIFATCTTALSGPNPRKQHGGGGTGSLRFGNKRGGGRHILNPSYWRKVHVQPLPYSELQEVASFLHPNIPDSVIGSALALLKSLDQSGRSHSSIVNPKSVDQETPDGTSIGFARVALRWTGGRAPSVRDFFKLLSRISNGVCYEKNAVYTTEAQRTLCLAESVDVFVGSCPDVQSKMEFVTTIAAPTWGVSGDLAFKYMLERQPTIHLDQSFSEIGRAKMMIVPSEGFHGHANMTFAQTHHALRLMESIAVCVRENEPILLVGETGTGKTTVVQQLAASCGNTLVVQNLSLQTDSTDLLGGYRPLEIQNVARTIYKDFVDIFVSTFSRKQNLKFLQYTASMFEKRNWKKLSQCFQRAATLGLDKMKDRSESDGSAVSQSTIDAWRRFSRKADRFEKQRLSCDAGLAFEFAEGALVEAIQSGKWILLDELNLASSVTLQRLCGLLDDPNGSVTLTERGDASAIERHPNFRLFAAMNPATDAGKKDLPSSIRGRFSELYVDELLDPIELRLVASRYLDGVIPEEGKAPEHTEVVATIVGVYLKCRQLAETILADGSGHKPRYTLRTLTRALSTAKSLVLNQRVDLRRGLLEGFQLAFEGTLESTSMKTIKRTLTKALLNDKKVDLDHPGRRPGGKKDQNDYVLVRPFWIKAGPLEAVDWSQTGEDGKSKFILTASVLFNLRRLSRALAAGPWPILLEGPTSSGKTTLVEYIAARCGHHVVRINNHEHTDVQEYTGSFAADQNGSLSFRDGILVQALRRGHWVILDELNLAPSEVLEALNRLLDDNRELYLAETNEIVKPHPNFRLFATQNPSGAYGGRKPLSRAFRNRFVDLHVGDIPSEEMITILEKRCGAPPSHAKLLVKIMIDLRRRRSKSNVFLGKDSFITPRDLLRWAERHCGSKQDLAKHGFMLLAERLRSKEEKRLVRDVIEEHTKTSIDLEQMYYADDCEAKKLLEKAVEEAELRNDHQISSIAPTRSLMRLICLVMNCIRQKEPVLLVGDTGCGKTTVVQLLSFIHGQTLHAVNCHATTETADLLGGLRPVRGRDSIKRRMILELKHIATEWPYPEMLHDLNLDSYLSFVDDTRVDAFEVDEMIQLGREIMTRRPTETTDGQKDKKTQSRKRRKLTDSSSPCTSDSENEVSVGDTFKSLEKVGKELEDLGRRFHALFEWSDGPLVQAMKRGDMLLLDEMSLADDAVLERLNSVLEPSRLLVLAEKGNENFSGGEDKDDRIIVAHDGFRIFATMNPGGDFGKRELSPALRSRFTEIWVPAITEREDFEVVLGRSLSQGIAGKEGLQALTMTAPMLNYVEWFNSVACEQTSSLFAGHSLSLRDVVSWAQFIAESKENSDVSHWDAFFHGACLMHLDGLGLGSGLSPEASAHLKEQAEKYLLGLIAGWKVANRHGVDEAFGIRESRFGATPYFIPMGSTIIPESQFNMSAPTTSMNTFRVLRAMQLKKPILLEGSPGTGKTSLVNALASASGHKLVRINLSEQTDIADLMGSDLPVSNSGTNGPSFEWRDGVLLTAIKEGSWVLLDELNLASQAVLEGLNSCLDHRATVYIPELGMSFACPQTFRVFAAQNPLGQGGGRKGLPKSFLNRFTKVYVDALTDSDMRSIVTSRFGKFSKEHINRVIDFNNAIHHGVVELRDFGLDGSPWEFNLRDVFRWFEQLETEGSCDDACARDLYYQRFRTQTDRDKVDVIFSKHFGRSLKLAGPPLLKLSDVSVSIGETTLDRSGQTNEDVCTSLASEPLLLLSHSLPMQTVARCVNLNWPCLLVGDNGTGKTAIISALAELCNATLIEHCLSPSSDVTDLVGGFEQVDNTSEERSTIEGVVLIAENVLASVALHSKETCRIWILLKRLKRFLASDNQSLEGEDLGAMSLELANEACDRLMLVLNRATCADDVSRDVQRMKMSLQCMVEKRSLKRHDDTADHFVWRDGILVNAMVKGHWILLENANLCPSSVLDRLNSVTERGGFLLLSESGTQDEEGVDHGHRLIRPHENFRVFLTMNASNGEISRAMRNRCVEVSLLEQPGAFDDSTPSKLQTVDVFNCVRVAGVRSLSLASKISTSYAAQCRESCRALEDFPCLRSVAETARVVSGMLVCGVSGPMALQTFTQLAFEVFEEGATLQNLIGDESARLSSLPRIMSLRQMCTNEPVTVHNDWESRLLPSFPSLDGMQLIRILGLLRVNTGDAQEYSMLETLECPPSDDLQFFLAQVFLGRLVHYQSDFQDLYSILNGLDNELRAMLLWMGNTLYDKDLYPSTANVVGQRLKQKYVEYKWMSVLETTDSLVDPSEAMSVLQASFYLHESLLNRSTMPCQLTRLMYPFFLAFDAWIERVMHRREVENADALRGLLEERDNLWRLLTELPFDANYGSFTAFDEADLIVQWQWLRKSLTRFTCVNVDGKQTVDFLVRSIDEAIFGAHRPSWSPRPLQKRMMSPLVPRKAEQWEVSMRLKSLSHACSLVSDERLDPFDLSALASSLPSMIDLVELLRVLHPILYVGRDDKMQLLAAICTTHLQWYGMNDKKGANDINWISQIDFPARMNELFTTLRDRFKTEVAMSKVDLDIQTVENQFEVAALEGLKDSSAITQSRTNSYSQLKNGLLSRYGKIQLAPMAEFWCTHQTIALCGQVASILLQHKDEKLTWARLQKAVPQMRRLVDTAITDTTWTVEDLRPFQTLIWAVEGKEKKVLMLASLARSLLPEMLSVSSSHSLSGTFVQPNAFSTLLEMPGLFIDHDAQQPSYQSSVPSNRTTLFGSARLRQPVLSELLVRMVGGQFSLIASDHNVFYTVENAFSRQQQQREMCRMLSSFSVVPSKARLFVYHYLLYDILESVKEVFQDDSMDAIVALVGVPGSLDCLSNNEIDKAIVGINNSFFSLFGSNLIVPLLKEIWSAWREDHLSLLFANHCARASIYLGLLRLKLVLPDSPIDPGRAPIAKISLIDRKLKEVFSHISARRLQSGFVNGSFTPRDDESMRCLAKHNALSQKRAVQQEKVIERIGSALPFHELFRAANDFLSSMSDCSSVLEIVDGLHDSEATNHENLSARAQNWQLTAAAFNQRLVTDFGGYEDVTTSILDSIRMIQDGLCDVVHIHHGGKDGLPMMATLHHELLRYPIKCDSRATEALLGLARAAAKKSSVDSASTECFDSVSIAILSRLHLKKAVRGLSESELNTSSLLFSGLSQSLGDLVTQEKEDATLETMQEKAFRQQFPDHRKDFHSLLQSDEDDVKGEEDEGDDDGPESTPHSALSEQQVDVLYQIYKRIFSENHSYLPKDPARKLAYHLSYASANETRAASGQESHSCWRQAESLGGHLFALSLVSIPSTAMMRIHPYFHDSPTVVDFQNEPCPSMALSAAAPLEALLARTTQLLNAFPGHSILVGLYKICDKVNKLNLMTTPIGKVMTGLEVVLKQAQDWEQHASERVQLGPSLVEIGTLISQWRKLELESWSNLVKARHLRFAQKAQKHWKYLHDIVLANDFAPEGCTGDEGMADSMLACSEEMHCAPHWVWKGSMVKRTKGEFSLGKTRMSDLKELVKALDTFILTSSLGEIEERLSILKCMAMELLVAYKTANSQSTWRLQQARTLFSISQYYSQYKRFLSKKLNDLKAPVETKLKSETKLAKWDTQSYYALAESTDRNQRKLMKILSEFDDSLRLNVGMLIQEDTCTGLRSNADAYDDFSSQFPTGSDFFPLQGVTAPPSNKVETQAREHGVICSYVMLPVDAKMIYSPPNNHLCKIGLYVRRMESMASMGDQSSDSSAWSGYELATSFCDSIFERIDSLREKSTRPMKERALVELFRELKHNGFSSTKWSSPSELKEMEQLFLLPTPLLNPGRLDAEAAILGKAEKYYLKCATEVHSLRSETLHMGSKYMSKREMELMVNLTCSGMHMLVQQRCLLSTLIVGEHELDKAISVMNLGSERLPLLQSKLQVQASAFWDSRDSAHESMRQCSLLLRSVNSLLDSPEGALWARDTVSVIDSLLSKGPKERSGSPDFISQRTLQSIYDDKAQLEKAHSLMLKCRNECESLSCLPLDVLETCLIDLDNAIEAACAIDDTIASKPSSKTENPSESFLPFSESLSSTVERILLTYQSLHKEVAAKEQDSEQQATSLERVAEAPDTLWQCHKDLLASCTAIDLEQLNYSLSTVIGHLRDLHENDLSGKNGGRECCVALVSNSRVLLLYLQHLLSQLLNDTLQFYASTAKLIYVVSRVFRMLVAKGYCSDETVDGDGDEEGDVSGMTFQDDNDGTGMGEGEGKKDVTDQIENEDQLAGLKCDKENEQDNQNPEERQQLNEEEAEQGMEMEGDFDGEMYDLPEKKPDDENDEEEQEGEEIDREMGEDANPDEQVVDEKMWNESDDEDEINKEEEKFEDGSGVEGDAIEGAMRTKDGEDEEEFPSTDEAKQGNENNPQEEKSGDENENDAGDVNEDFEDNYEDQHGVDVRAEENEQLQDDPSKDDDGAEMQLDENMDLDGNNMEDEGNGDDADNDNSSRNNEDEEGKIDNAEENSLSEGEQEEDEGDNGTSVNPSDGAMEANNPDDNEQQDDHPEEDEGADRIPETANDDHFTEEAHGVKSQSGANAIVEDAETEQQEDRVDDSNEAAGKPSDGKSSNESAEADGDTGQGFSDQANDQSADSQPNNRPRDIPNPLKDPGDASKFWHRRLNVIESNDQADQQEDHGEADGDTDQPDEQKTGDHEYSANPADSTQVLGEATEDEAVELDPTNEELGADDVDTNEEAAPEKEGAGDDDQRDANRPRPQNATSRSKSNQNGELDDEEDKDDGSVVAEMEKDMDIDDNSGIGDADVDDVDMEDVVKETTVISDLSRMNVEEEDGVKVGANNSNIQQDDLVAAVSIAQAEQARMEWQTIQGETTSLSRRLCEKLRLVMEPLVASKLRGDYRTGKRINMKKVIGYIASGYRKDKIWLRRTKPAKRDYRVLLAVDDSESMKKSGAGAMALRAMATVAVGMNQLEVGDVGVASFGDDMKLVHPFHAPFTPDSGADIVRNFQFDQPRTRMALCVESAMAALDESGGNSSTMQLVFLISDGRIERDSRSRLKRLIREMMERNILLAMIIVEGTQIAKKDSIVNMKEVTFENGKPNVKSFIEDYPFPYYIVLDDVTSLPEVLGDALKQWFEMLGQLQASSI